MLIIVVNNDINKAISIIDFIFAPDHIMINGPKDTFGNEFIIVRYGSIIFDMFLFHHIIVAIIRPIILDNKKLIITSNKVIFICDIKLLCLNKLYAVFITSVGDDVRNLLAILNLTSNSQVIRNINKIAILNVIMIILFLLIFFK